MAEKEFSFDNKELVEAEEPLAWELLSFVIAKLPDEKQEEMADDIELLNLVLAVKNESGENAKNLRKIALKAQNIKAIEKLGQMLNPPLTEKEITKLWMLDSIKKSQAKNMMN